MRNRDKAFLGFAIALGTVLLASVAEAKSLEHLLESQTGVTLIPGENNSLVGHIASCTVVVQDQHAEGIKVFSFDGANSLDPNMGLSARDIASLKAELGNAHMTNDELMGKLESTNKEMAIKVIDALKSSCALTS